MYFLNRKYLFFNSNSIDFFPWDSNWGQDSISSSNSLELNRPHFYQTRSAWSMDQGSNKNHSPVNNCAPTVTKFCVMWEGQALSHDTKFGNYRDKIVDSRAFLSWSLIHGSSWSGLIKLGPGDKPLSESGHLSIIMSPGFNELITCWWCFEARCPFH